MEHSDDKTQLLPSRSTWILSTSDGSIADMVVTPGKVITLGRQAGCDIVITDRYVSRRHAEVFVRDDQLFVRDLQSTHGTLVNGQPVTECALRPGDELRLDKAVFSAQRLNGGAQAAQPAADDGDKTVMRRLDEVAASLDAAAQQASPAVAPSEIPPQPPPEPAREVPPATPAAAPAAAPPPAPAPEVRVDADREAVAPAAPQDEAPADEARRSKNWWDPQDAGPMGTRLVRVKDGVEEVHAELAPQLETDRPMLVGISPAFRERQYELQPGKMIVGKKPDADIRLDDEYVSDVHAQIVGEGARWKVVNILSANGTFVNGKKIQAAYLRSGDVVRFGRVDLQFVDGTRAKRSKIGAGGSTPGIHRLAWIGLGFLVTVMILALAFLALR